MFMLINKKIAVPVDEKGILAGHFGHSKLFILVTVKDGKIASSQKLVPPPHKAGAIPKWLIEQEVTDVISRGIGEKAQLILNKKDIKCFTGAPFMPWFEVVESYLNNTLESTGEHCNHGKHEHEHKHNCNH